MYMLEIRGVKKVYQTGGVKRTVLNDVRINFRESEFAAILGPSGSGKTTLLNIVGGLDDYTAGDLKINEKSTKKFRDRDWDAYRNYKIGFVFQSYNLIGHQTVLSNVELALTLGGVSKKERKNIMAKLQEQAVKLIYEICDRYRDEKTPLMMILSDIQKEYGYIPLEVQEIVSEKTGISVAEIYGVVTFYSFFSLTPKGKYVIGVCLGTACYVKGSQLVLDKFGELLGINRSPSPSSHLR